jgi:hypothetical protein
MSWNNSQTEREKRTDNDLQETKQKTKDWTMLPFHAIRRYHEHAFIFQMRKVSMNCRQLLYINCNDCGIKFIYGKKIRLFKEYEYDQYFQELSRLQHKNILSFQLRNFDETVKDWHLWSYNSKYMLFLK